MKSFREFMESDLNEVLDLIEEEIIAEEYHPKVSVHQPWPNFEPENPHAYKRDEFKRYYHKHIKPVVDKAEKPFTKLLHKVGTKKVKIARKSLDSLHDKVVKRKRPSSEIHDVLRGAILTKDNEESKKIVDALKKTGKVLRHEYKHHQHENKESGMGGTHHVLVDMNGTQAEVQVLPHKLFKAKQEHHHIYRKYRSMKNPESHPDYQKDMDAAKKIFSKNIKEK